MAPLCAPANFASFSNATLLLYMINAEKSPLLLVALALAAGIAMSSLLASPGFWFLILMVMAAAVLFWLTKRRVLPRLQQLSHIGIYLCFSVAGWVLGESAAVISPNDPQHFIGQTVEVEGYVAEEVRTTPYGRKTIFQCSSPMEGKVILYLPPTATAVKTNDILKGTLHLSAISQKNPGYAQWLHHQSIHAVAKAEELTKTGEKSGFFASLANLRSQMAERMTASFPDRTTAGLSKAMLLGDRTELDSELKQDFSATGLSHIVAISGMNFVIIYGVLTVLLHPLLYFRRGRQIRSLIVVPILAFFAALTGGNPAVVRAAIMLGMLDFSQAFWSKNNSLNALATSALIFLAFDPQSLFTPDFQLSYAAVLGILLLQDRILHYFQRRMPKAPKWLFSGLAVTLAAQAATTPLVAVHFHSFPTYFLLANMLVLPIATLAIQIGFAGFVLAWIPGLDIVWGGIMDFLLWSITGLAELLAQLPGATITALEASQMGIWVLLLQVVAGLVVLERKFLKKAVGHLRSQTPSPAFAVAIVGIRQRLATVCFLFGWVLIGFVF
jgi:ComEC/Rec2-related protein